MASPQSRDPDDGGDLFGQPERSGSPGREPPTVSGVMTVTQLTRKIGVLVGGLGRVSVEGELTRVTRAASGHVYFDLKDLDSKLACTLWKSQVAAAARFELREGMQVIAHGKLDVYAPRGTYSLNVQRIEQAGIGALLVQLEALKAELAARGWFDRKRPLPSMPRRIGVVTSRDGAAFQDFLRTRSLRWPGYPVILAHTPVQGASAAAEIARAIGRLDRLGVDVIVVCRGGGSLEDLWAFNELAVAEAVWSSRTPIVSGVGHQTDVSLCDLVADFRAHTPTDAAQTVIPDRASLVGDLSRSVGDLAQAIDGAILRREEALQRLASARVLRDPGAMLSSRDADLVHLRERLSSATLRRVGRCEAQLSEAHRKLDAHAPRTLLAHSQHAVSSAGLRLSAAIRTALERAEQREQVLASQLEAFSPLAILARGYSITMRAGSTQPLSSADGLAVGDELSTRLHRGRVHSRVTRTEPPEA